MTGIFSPGCAGTYSARSKIEYIWVVKIIHFLWLTNWMNKKEVKIPDTGAQSFKQKNRIGKVQIQIYWIWVFLYLPETKILHFKEKEISEFRERTDILKCITRSNQHQKRFESSQICLQVPCRPSLILWKFSMIKSFISDDWTYDFQVVIIDGRIVHRDYSGPVRSQKCNLFW